LTISRALDCACAGCGSIVANSRAAEIANEHFTAIPLLLVLEAQRPRLIVGGSNRRPYPHRIAVRQGQLTH
jgi:hypothetical protein